MEQHRFNKVKWEDREKKKKEIIDNPGNENTVINLRKRIENIEMALDLK
jgi:hypothetical protein